jgi:predicted hydrocarbon binding protein
MEEKQIPSLLLNILFAQVDEMMGHRSLTLLLRQAGLNQYLERRPPLDDSPSISVSEYSRLLATMHDVFGFQSARPILLRGGQLSAAELRRQRPAQMAVGSVALKLLPAARRMQIALDRFAGQGEELYGAVCHVAEEADAFLFDIEDCPYCAEITRRRAASNGWVSRPVCHIAAASIEETIEWATAEKHMVEEVACIAMGDPACSFRICK